MVAERNPEIRRAVNTLYDLSADAQVRAEYEARQKAWRDRESQFDHVRNDTLRETAQRMKDRGLPAEDIMAVTGLRL